MLLLKSMRIKLFLIMGTMIFVSLLPESSLANPDLLDRLEALKQAYPDKIQAVNKEYITWYDGTKMYLNNKNSKKSFLEKLTSPSLEDQLEQTSYPIGQLFHINDDPGRIRYEPFFRKMYGNSAREVESKLRVVYWLPKIFGKKYPLEVTTVNSVDKKIKTVSDELEELVTLHPEFLKYVENPGGFFKWRTIASTNRLSSHSFGIAIDINTRYSDYWQWDLKRRGLPIDENTKLMYKNRIPWEVIEIFEKNGFIWGGKWYHYDTMHFEYRPELLLNTASEKE